MEKRSFSLTGAALLTIFVLLIIQSCTSDTTLYKMPKFKSTSTGEFEVVSDDLYFGHVVDLFIYESYAIVVGYNENCYLHIYNKNNGELLNRAIYKGRGPKELAANPDFVEFDTTSGILTIPNNSKGVNITCSIKGIVNNEPDAIYEDFSTQNNFVNNCFPIAENKTLYMYNYSPMKKDTANLCRFSIENDQGETLSKYTKYPHPYEENTFLRWNFYNPGNYSICYSSDKEKFAIGISRGAILETFSISDNNITPLSVSHFIDPEFNGTLQELNYILGFIDLFATDKYVYAVFDGDNYVVGSSFYDIGQNLVQFDWSGKPLQKINMGVRMEKICIDPNSNTLYALIKSENEGCTLAKYKLRSATGV